MRTRPRLINVLAAALVFVLVSGAETISAYQFIEDFGTLDYCDVGRTEALWDTGSGSIRLHPYEPRVIASYLTPGPANTVVLRGDYAYVAADLVGGLQVIDVSDPSSPSLVGSCDTDGAATGLDVAGDFAYVADGLAGLSIIDITDP